MAAKARWQIDRWGLSSRIVALSLFLLLLVQMAVFSVVRISIDQSAHRQVEQELLVGERVWRRLLDQNAQKLAQGASLLAADYAFRDAVSTQDDETIRSALQNHGARIGATVTALIDTQMSLRAVAEGQDGTQLQTILGRITSPEAQSNQGGQIALIGNTPYQFVLVPMRAPVVVGWVLMGFPVGQRLLDDMRALSDMHLALLVEARGTPARVVASTLPEQAFAAFEGSSGVLTDVSLSGDLLVSRSIKLDAGEFGSVHTVILRSLNDVVAPFRQTQMALAWITGLGVILFALGSVFAARRVTTPLRDLVQATKVLGEGRYDVPLAHTDRLDEIGELAQSFDAMRLSIGAQQSEIRRLAYWDRLTGLPNRAQFREAVQSHLLQHAAELSGTVGTMSVLILDMDRFKHVNDVLGYSFGDQLLIAVSLRLTQQEMRSGDMVARLGGDEFAVMLVGSDATLATNVAQRIAKSFELPLALQDQTVDMSASMGIACYPQHAGDVDTLLSRAEVAMYAAKERTTLIQVYEATMDSTSTEMLSMLSELRNAVALGELRLFLQPKISLQNSSVVAAEALVRWQHPQRGLVPPLDFIPFAEQTGFVRQLTLWVFEEAAKFLQSVPRDLVQFRVAVNLSTRDLLDPDFPERLNTILLRNAVAASGFCLEITESAIMDDPQRAQSTLNVLSQRGFKLSIDDFGTGYSSLAYLKSLPVDELKIDKSFVMNMETDEDDAKIVRSTVDLAHNLGLTIVAEGVENVLIWNNLRELGCDEAQGYFMSAPLRVSDFWSWQQSWVQRMNKPAIAV